MLFTTKIFFVINYCKTVRLGPFSNVTQQGRIKGGGVFPGSTPHPENFLHEFFLALTCFCYCF